jgi:CheY-like chemotaxis protein
MNAYKNILLVDDDSDDQFFFSDALKEVDRNIRIYTADNGADALNKIKVPPPPDLIFLDLNMPVMNGFEFIAEIRKVDKLKNIPVVIYTTSSNNHDMEAAFKLGAKQYLIKPTEFSKLKTILAKTLRATY